MTGELEKLGKYEILGVLGKGAMGIVYRARDPIIHRLVALKTIGQHFSEEEIAAVSERFVREAQAAGRLNHPNIVSVYEYGEDDGRAYIAMEYVEGKTLADLTEHGSKLDTHQICNIVSKVLEGLAYAHANGVIHRDIKPSNIILTDQGEVKVTDFGIARIESSSLTQFGAILGTPGYMSPEQLLGEQIDHRSDVFSCGILLYELLTGEKAFTGTNISSVIYKVIHNELPPPTNVSPTLPKEFDYIVAKALAKSRDARFQTAEEFSTSLKALRSRQSHAGTQPEDLQIEHDGSASESSREAKSVSKVNSLSPDQAVAGQAKTVSATTLRPTRVLDGGTDSDRSRKSGRGMRRGLLLSSLVIALAGGGYFIYNAIVTSGGQGITSGSKPELHDESVKAPAYGETASLPASGSGSLHTPTVNPYSETLVAKADLKVFAQPSERASVTDDLAEGSLVKVSGIVEGTDWLQIKGQHEQAAYVLGNAPEKGGEANFYRSGQVFIDCANCPEMVVVLPDIARAGVSKGEAARRSSEISTDAVAIDYPIAVGRYEVTKGEFLEFVRASNYDAHGCYVYDGIWSDDKSKNWKSVGFEQGDYHPVTCVSWADARAYTDWLSKKTGKDYRLPSSAEWEFVARAGSNEESAWGNATADACERANVADEAAQKAYDGWAVHACTDGYVYTAPVGSFEANGFGLYDTLGNVFEWVEDCWSPSEDVQSVNGGRDLLDSCDKRILRGGSWFSMPEFVRLDFENRFPVDHKSSTFGFRVARRLD